VSKGTEGKKYAKKAKKNETPSTQPLDLTLLALARCMPCISLPSRIAAEVGNWTSSLGGHSKARKVT